MSVKKSRRQTDTNQTNFDTHVIEQNTYNDPAGVLKSSDFGKKLKPYLLTADPVAYTTDFSTSRPVEPGTYLAIYNNGALASLTLSQTLIASLAVGTTDSAGNVGIALKANDWTYVSVYDAKFAITSASTALVYIVEDDSMVTNR